MSFATQICLTRPKLEQTMFNLIERGIITNFSYYDVRTMSWITMFYTALKHSKGYNELIERQIQALDLTKPEFDEVFKRIQTLIEHFQDCPPINIHLNLLKSLTMMANFYGSFTPLTDVQMHIELNRVLYGYLKSIAELIHDVTSSDDDVQEFLLDSTKFYPNEMDLTEINIETESTERIVYVQQMNEFIRTIRRVNLLPQIMGYIFRNAPNTSAVFTYTNISIPIVGNFLPPSLKRLLVNMSFLELVENHFSDDSIVNESSRIYGNPTEVYDLFDDFITNSEFQPSPARSNRMCDHCYEEPNLPGYEQTGDSTDTETPDGKLDDLSQASTQSELSIEETTSSLTSDTLSHSTNSILVNKIRYELNIIKRMDRIPDHLLHIIRFNTDVERPTLVFKCDVKEKDFRVSRGENETDGSMIVTFSVATRRPIFNPVI